MSHQAQVVKLNRSGERIPDDLREKVQKPSHAKRGKSARARSRASAAAAPLPANPPKDSRLGDYGRECWARLVADQRKFDRQKGTRAFLFAADVKRVEAVCFAYEQLLTVRDAAAELRESTGEFDGALFDREQRATNSYAKLLGGLGYGKMVCEMTAHFDLKHDPDDEEDGEFA